LASKLLVQSFPKERKNMSDKVTTVSNQITTQTLIYLPAVLAGVQVAEASQASGADKAQAVVDAVIAGSGAVAQIPGAPPQVAAVSGLVNLAVSILNALGVFKHKAVV
jgi:hypothetical protein